MRKSLKNFGVTFLALFLMLFQLSTIVFAKTNIPQATDEFYVNDFANVLSDEEEKRILDKAVTLAEESDGIQVVLSTVESLDGNSIENYALEMYNQYKIGKDDMGLLILLSTGDRQIRIEVGKAMEAYINDSKAGRLMDEYAIPYLKDDKFNEGLINLQESLISEVTKSVAADSETSQVVLTTSDNKEMPLKYMFYIFLFLDIIMFISIIYHRTKIKKQNIVEKELANSEESLKKEVSELKVSIGRLKNEKENLLKKFEFLQGSYNTLKDRYKRAQVFYPDLDKKVSDMIQEELRKKNMAIAEEVDKTIEKVINLQPNKDIVPKLKNAIACYSSLSKEQKAFIKSDISKLEKLYNESVTLKRKKAASDAFNAITDIIAGITIGKARHLSKLKEAKSIYENLDAGSRKYFDKSVLDRLNSLYRSAKRDKEEEEEEERRREEEERLIIMSSSSNFDFNNDSHFGGFGGSSGGGGASRGF